MTTTWQTKMADNIHDPLAIQFAQATLPFDSFDLSSPSAYPLPIEHHQHIAETSNISAASSPISSTDLEGWTTVASTESVGSNPTEPETDQTSWFSTTHGTPTKPAAGAGLSIDPSLFKPKQRYEAQSSDASDDDEDDAMPTARPLGKLPTMPTPSKPKHKSSSPKKSSHARKQNPDHIPRPRNAFILFRKHVVDAKLIPASVEVRHQNVSIITAKMWAEASPDQKAHFNDLAKIEKEEHMKKYPGYRYQPVYRRTNVIRRRVRKDEAEEEKCQSVADLLMKGTKGEQLEEEIKERMQKENLAKTRKDRAAAAKKANGAGAVALSKGALRALRAKGRQEEQESLEWSALSRSSSVAPSVSDMDSQYSYDPRAQQQQQHQQQQQQQQQSLFVPQLTRRNSVFSELSALSGQYQQHQHQQQQQQQQYSLFSGAGPELVDVQPQTATWVGQQQLAQQQQMFAYSQPMSQDLNMMAQYQYSQMGQIPPSYSNGWNEPLQYQNDHHHNNNNMPSFDAFSQITTNSNIMPDMFNLQAPPPLQMHLTPPSDMPGSNPLRDEATSADLLFSAYTSEMVSPTAGTFQQTTTAPFPQLEQWDQAAFAPLSNDVVFDGFGLDGTMVLGNMGTDRHTEPFLDDFGAALAQAEEIRGW